MSKFFLLYLAPVSAIEQMMANSNPEQMKAGMDAWMGWMKKHEKAIVDMGAPLGKTKRVTATSVASVRNEVTGYTIVEAGSHDAAAAMLVGHPHLRREALFLEQLAHQFHRCSFIAPPLHEQVENLAFVVNRAPEPELPARDRHGHLIERPSRGWPQASTPKFSGEQRPEL